MEVGLNTASGTRVHVRATAALCAVLLAVCFAVPARADTHTDRAEARDLFEAAKNQAANKQWRAAEDLLKRSLEKHPHVAAAYYLGTTVESDGRLLEAIAIFEALLGEKWGKLTRQQRSETTAHVAEVRSHLSRIVVVLITPNEASVTVDNHSPPLLTQHGVANMDLDPGRHSVHVEADGFLPMELEVTAEQGATTRREISLQPVPKIVVERAPLETVPNSNTEPLPVFSTKPLEKEHSDEGSDHTWLFVGVGAVAVAAATVAVILLTSGSGAPSRDPVFGITEALGR